MELGWSETGPLPRHAYAFAAELHTLLTNANITGPYVMVGHSLGGLIVRVFARDYPVEVAGVVLIDSMTPQQFSRLSEEVQLPRPDSPTRKDSFLTTLARIGFVRLTAKLFGLVPSTMIENKAYYSRLVLPQNVQTFVDESRGMPASGAQTTGITSFGSMPLIVLTAKKNDMPHWPEWQTELLKLSSNSTQLFAENSGHNIHEENPQAAVSAILQMVSELRSR